MIIATYLTIWMALALFVLAEVGRATGDNRARAVSAAGLVLALVHTLLAFDTFHQWSHADAVLSTAQQTQEVFGLAAGAGLYVNYLFFAVWLLEIVFWRAVTPASALRWVVRVFYLVIIFNGAVVFASGWRRALGAAIVGVLLWTWIPGYWFARRVAQ